MNKWFDFEGIAVFNHEEKRFWSKKEIKELAQAMWNDLWSDSDTPNKHATNDDLKSLFLEEFHQFTDEKTHSHNYWDDEGIFEMVFLPQYYGFGIVEDDSNGRFKELVQEIKG